MPAKLAVPVAPGFDRPVTIPSAVKAGLSWASAHTGLPVLVVAGVAVVVGYKILKRTARFAVEVTVISLALAVATEAGWLRW